MELSNSNTLSAMKKSSCASNNLGSFPSPGAAYYRENMNRSLGEQKGWYSERIPISKACSNNSSNSISRRHSLGGLTPFSVGRNMPSKWDEAERWICSPVSAYAESRSSHNGPKSISGPIVVPHGHGHGGVAAPIFSHHSPAVPLRQQGLVVRNLVVGSPFSTGVLAPVAVSVHHYDHDAAVFGYDIDHGMQYSSPVVMETGAVHSSMSTCPELPSLLLCPISREENQDEKMDEDKVKCQFSRCDKGTQMSPAETESETHSSPKSSGTSSVMDQQGFDSPKLEVRDVQVDSQATIVRWSKRHATKLTKKDSIHSKDLREISAEAQSSSWDFDESTLDTSKFQREEAKIIAWENLQKAKAEAAIRKLEMKLEKKRSLSMDKILNKLRRAQLKAEHMRSSMPEQQDHQVSQCRAFSFTKYVQIWSPTSCFSSHAQ